MTSIAEPVSPGRPASLPLRFAFRELRGGLRGFYVFIACIALGVMTIAGDEDVEAAQAAAQFAESKAQRKRCGTTG